MDVFGKADGHKVQCFYEEYNNGSLGGCEECKSFSILKDALMACCNDQECSGVTEVNSEIQEIIVFELRIGFTLNSANLQKSYVKASQKYIEETVSTVVNQ